LRGWGFGAAAAALLLAGSCGPGRLAVRSSPFPAERPVFLDAAGTPLKNLPPAPEPARLVLLDFPWCPPCGETWKALKKASPSVPPGSARVFRVLFDRERLLSREGAAEVPPLSPAPPADAGSLPVTTLLAIPGTFLDLYRIDRSPVLLLVDRGGTIVQRWNGYSPGLADQVSSGIRRLSNSPPRPGT
jgi:hypothetical protein